MVAKLTAEEREALDLLSNLEEQIIFLCQKMDAAQTAFNLANPQFKRTAIELNSDFLSKTVVVQLAFPLEANSLTAASVGEVFYERNTTPAPTPIPNAGDVSYVASASSVYEDEAALQPTYQKLTDHQGNTGTGTQENGAQWLQATFSTPVRVQAVTVGGGAIPEWGPVALYLNGAVVQYSANGNNWMTATTVAGVADSGVNQFKQFQLGNPVTARFWRLSREGFLSTTELRFE